MADLHLVTGYKGTAHITSDDQGLFNAGCVGSADFVLATGDRFNAEVISNNTVRIYNGSLLMSGRHVNMKSTAYIDMAIANGTTGSNRNDLIVVRYTKNQSTGIESAELMVLQGASTTGVAVDPSYNATSILSGGAVYDMRLYRVRLSGLNIEAVEPLFTVLAPVGDIHRSFYRQNLLVNGDFQCNQRGKTSYEVADTSSYSVDMWRIYQVKLDVLTEGVRITGKSSVAQGYFTQFVDVVNHKDIYHTISAMVDDKICTFTVELGATAQEKNFGKFKITALRTSTWNSEKGAYDNRLKINICPIGMNSITIKYVDLFEGTIAYPHVKEDSATAMMRCRRYIQGGATVCPTMYLYTSDSKYSYRFAITHEPMVGTPSLVKCDWLYFDTGGKDATGTASNVEIMGNSNNVIQLKTAYGNQKNAQCNGIRAVYIVSCEHAPNGD